ncbi:glycosyltransferase family 2 protein [Brevundimonas staleyi]|uniref:Glycosyltransferase family 2 protein n=1 Tax=Brevundimonas staleyi TaxID=74326 RepID=A0ABW0FZD2_9CAUL
MKSVAVLILTHNEALHIRRSIESVSTFASEVFLIDSGSTDRTVEIAESLGATVLKHPWTNYAQQFQWGLDHAPITADWVMRLDADEVIEADLAAEIGSRLLTLPTGVSGVNLKRKHVFMGRWIKHGGRYPLTLLRIWRSGKARIEQRWMDEHMLLTEGSTVTFDGGFADVNLNDLTFFTDKHNKYASREAIDVLNQKYDLFPRDEALDAKSASAAASGKRWLKEGLYNRLPFWVGPLGYFLYRYIIQLGFLDGREGLIYHGLQGGWYRFLVAAKIVEWDRELSKLENAADQLAMLERLTGYRLAPAS